MSWKRFRDKPPRKGDHILALGGFMDGNQWMWWGYYNPSIPKDTPPDVPEYYCKIEALPILPLTPKEELCESELKTSEE